MFTDWLLRHPTAPLLLAWGAGSGWAGTRLRAGRPRMLAILVALVALTVVEVLGVAPLVMPTWAEPFVDAHGVRLGVQWAILAVLIVITVVPGRRSFGVLSLFPLLAGGVQGGGALLAGVVIVATGALEPRQPGRFALLAAMLLLPLAQVVEEHSLLAWIQLVNHGLGFDSASLVVDMGTQVVRFGGWAAALVAVAARCGAAAQAREVEPAAA